MKQMFLLVTIVVYLGANTIEEYETGLVWQDNYDAKTITRDWQGAKDYCQELRLVGTSDWRLPTIKELQSIVDIKQYNPIIKKVFKHISSKDYWSSSEHVLDTQYAWKVDFNDGGTDYDSKSNEYFFRCVRDRK